MEMIKEEKGYVSASQLNRFIDYRDDYIRKYVFHGKWMGNASFSRGNAIEQGLQYAIEHDASPELAAEKAWGFYLDDCEKNDLSGKERDTFDREHIEAMTNETVRYYQVELGSSRAVKCQEKVSCDLPGIDKPLLGYMDFVFPQPEMPLAVDRGIRDLKTAKKAPSKFTNGPNAGLYKLDDGYARQGTLYAKATGRPVTFDFVVAYKAGPKVISVPLLREQMDESWKVMVAASKALQEFWNCIPSPENFTPEHRKAFMALSFPQFKGVWNEDEKKALMEEYVTG